MLCAADAAVIIGATLLHDIAMHLCPDGFLELVSKDSRFQPLPWFKESHEDHAADRPWHELWEDYLREARRFSDRDLTNIVGEESARVWKFHDLPKDKGQWERNHCLIIGELIRRHHARLAHEIAMYGFPGLPAGSGEGQFPAMDTDRGHPLNSLADLIGLTARSHGMSLRACKTYLASSSQYSGTPRPEGTAVLYPMALLRVADYLQIDRQRAPAVLLQLRNPQSPISTQEWEKHRAIQFIGPADDPRGKRVTVSTDLSLPLYLQLRDLLAGLQAEMDHSTAVLDEAYGNLTKLELDQLNLATRRVYSNLQSPIFRDSLPYVPNRTGFTADPNLLTLLVEPLYGQEPSVGIRELIQNAADAVCELEAWCTNHRISIDSLNLPEQEGDVLVDFIKRENGTWFLRVRDRGIGMTADTIQNYFLRAGASFRRSAEWAKEFLDEEGRPRVARAGRFGVGAFAIFLLGPSFRLRTRHVSEAVPMGYTFEAAAHSQLIEIRRDKVLSVGTTIEVEMNSESVAALELEKKKYSVFSGPGRMIDWFCWDWPKVIKRIVCGPGVEVLDQRITLPIRRTERPPEWFAIHPKDFETVYWAFGYAPILSCNGLRIARPSALKPLAESTGSYFSWPAETQLQAPCIAVIDSAANLRLTIQRYELAQEPVPFIEELTRDVTLSFIAHALVCGPMSRSTALFPQRGHPLRLTSERHHTENWRYNVDGPFSVGLLRWCSTAAEAVPSDVWLYTLLSTESCFVFGTLDISSNDASDHRLTRERTLLESMETNHCAALARCGISVPEQDRSDGDWARQLQNLAGYSSWALGHLAQHGVPALGHNVATSRVLVSSSDEIDFAAGHTSPWLGLAEHREPGNEIWKEIGGSNPQRSWFEARHGNLTPSIPLEDLLKALEKDLSRENVVFVAEIRTKRVESAPESLIARIWNECLGARAIPFDPIARKALIADGCKHPELKRHIEAWEKMKSSGSEWVTS